VANNVIHKWGGKRTMHSAPRPDAMGRCEMVMSDCTRGATQARAQYEEQG